MSYHEYLKSRLIQVIRSISSLNAGSDISSSDSSLPPLDYTRVEKRESEGQLPSNPHLAYT
jgi:hypothetical protein